MPSGVAQELGAAIRERLTQLPEFQETPIILTYVSSIENEADTHALIKDCLAVGRQVLVPVAMPGRRLVWSVLREMDDLAQGRFGVLEPMEARRRLVEPPPGALALVPGLVFTPEGDRIGFGGGYYDRFLATFSGMKVGLAYDMQIVPSIPLEAHDVPMDAVVTEAAVYRRSPWHQAGP